MKRLSLFLAILLFGCSQKENELESIEIMSYYYNYDENTKLFVDLDEYSKIYTNGDVEIIKRVKPFEPKYIYLKSKIDTKIILNIGETNKSLNDEYYESKIDTNRLDVYDGPVIRVKLKYKNDKVISFTYEQTDKYENDLKYSLFLKTQKAISDNYNKKYYEIIDSINIKKSQKEFEIFAFRKDTLSLPMPPKPIDPSEQIKFPPPNK
ncbi:hypothetical protein FCR2A7T_06730 [Flavobacterium cauense R2A-7]|uniref:hypothetical protein n=1 Tax=Flavobacterium cauense TaxID=510946 RepID=UPI0003C60824|nr:hypothetical protein [Flavobacterium cauense]ESU21246.1 hypothetical protein FCR2A7T_06730 [Flavobacterium cauense R2A-7]KGO79301.1 hypothetical protein Q762_14500 [Flavobacterium cauense R2A-7]